MIKSKEKLLEAVKNTKMEDTHPGTYICKRFFTYIFSQLYLIAL